MPPSTETRRFDVALLDPSQMDAAVASSCLARAIHYYQLLWGIFSPCDLMPDPSTFGRFSIALQKLETVYPLDLASYLEPLENQPQGWLINLHCLHQVEAHRIMDEWKFTLPSPYEFSDIDRYQRRVFVQAYIRHCTLRQLTNHKCSWVNIHRRRAEIEFMIAGKFICTGTSKTSVNPAVYVGIFDAMYADQGPFPIPAEPSL